MAKSRSKSRPPKFLQQLGGSALDLQKRFDLATEAERQGRESIAEELFLSLAKLFRGNGMNPAACLASAGRAQVNQRKFKEAIVTLEKAFKLNAEILDVLINLAISFKERQNWAGVEFYAEKAVTLAPDESAARLLLGWAQHHQKKIAPALQNFTKVLAANPDHWEALIGLASTYARIGEQKMAMQMYDRLFAVKPGEWGMLSGFLMNMLYSAETTAQDVLDQHLRFEEIVGVPLRSCWKPFANTRDPNRKIKIGYVSGDLRNHVIAYYCEGVIAGHDRERFEVYCYYNHDIDDVTTKRLKASSDHWVDIYGKSDDEVEAAIRETQIDILIDLSGHTGHHRLPLFARKPAPIQVTWMGCCCTTGLRAMDYIVADDVMTPSDRPFLGTEKPLRLSNGFTTYKAPPAPDVSEPPKLKNGYVTFSCFNNPMKITADQVDLWVQILLNVPDSRFVFSYDLLQDPIAQAKIRGAFDLAGIARDRVEFAKLNGVWESFQGYRLIDISLDTFPYTGCTTTLEALWMGVPVITRPGETFVSRVSASMLAYAGLSGLICETPEDYIRRAVELANDTETLVRLRSSLRDHLKQTALYDPSLYTKTLETSLSELFQNWCHEGTTSVAQLGEALNQVSTPNAVFCSEP